MARSKTRKPDRAERREEALRPSRFLGYNRDAFGVYLLSRHAPELAEPQFRRAIWLNPYEPAFQEHLAVCLCRLGRYGEAKRWARKALEQGDAASLRQVLAQIERMEHIREC